LKTAFIINPNSSGGSTGRSWKKLREPLLEAFPGAEEIFTTGRGDATLLTRKALRGGAELILGVGGDGTNNEVINGFFEEETEEAINPEASFTFAPRGTGCDLARYFGVPRDFRQAAPLLRDAPSWPIDVGILEVTTAEGGTARHFFINVLDFGIGGLISSRVNKTSKRMGGFLSFAWHTVVSLFLYQDQEMVLEIPGQEDLQDLFRSVVLANGKYFGGGMNINPHGAPDDGLLDLITLPAESILNYLQWMPSLYGPKGILDHPKVLSMQVKEFRARTVDPEAEVWVEMDGENPGKLPARVRILPRALKIRCPRPS
jgi:YegS/Rv2252/BmrU family lipid kinase